MLTLSCQQQSLVHALIDSIQKIFDVYQYNITFINEAVLDTRFKLQWENHAEICACIQNNICSAMGEIPSYPIPVCITSRRRLL